MPNGLTNGYRSRSQYAPVARSRGRFQAQARPVIRARNHAGTGIRKLRVPFDSSSFLWCSQLLCFSLQLSALLAVELTVCCLPFIALLKQTSFQI